MKDYNVRIFYGFWYEKGQFYDLFEPSCENRQGDNCPEYLYGYEYCAPEMHGRCQHMHSWYDFCTCKAVILPILYAILRRLTKIQKIYTKYKPIEKIKETDCEVCFNVGSHNYRLYGEKRFEFKTLCILRDSESWDDCHCSKIVDDNWPECIYLDGELCKNKTMFYSGIEQMIVRMKTFIEYYEEMDDDLSDYKEQKKYTLDLQKKIRDID